MGKTLACKILSKKAEKGVSPGEFIEIEPDIALANDVTAPLAIKEFKATNKPLAFPNRLVLVSDHFVPARDIRSANQAKILRDFAKEYNIKHYFKEGSGIEHCLLPDEGIVLPSDVVIGADSHTCTYGALGAFSTGVGSTDIAYFMATGKIWLKVPESMRIVFKGNLAKYVSGKDLILYTIGKIGVDGANYMSMEFCGDAIKSLSMAGRFTMCNMAIEAGAKAGIVEPDEKTMEYVKNRAPEQPTSTRAPDYKIHKADSDAEYKETYEFNCSDIDCQVALPHLPSNTKSVKEVGDIKIDQAFIGSCTNGRLDDLRISAEILKGKKINPDIRLIIIPGTQEIYKEAIKEGLIDVFIDAGGIISCPTCGPCLGGHMGVLADFEKCISTTNRNFIGRMGSLKGEVYLAGSAVVSASAITGKITHPNEVI
ncbi:MAG: 3-isopropylmalate dehydratase large subunit [bacterium]